MPSFTFRMQFWVKLCGIYNLFWGIMHLWFIYQWRLYPLWSGLPAVAADTFDIFNIQITIVFFTIAYIYFFQSDAVLSSATGKALAIGVMVFWLCRAVVELGLVRIGDFATIAVFVLGAIIHAIVVIRPASRT